MNKPAVMITGASSGIGLSCALRMAQKGHRVFAGVRQPADAERLQREGAGNVTPVMVDVAKDAEVHAAAELIKDTLRGAPLLGLVNNAGIVLSGPLEIVGMSDFRRQFDVNLFGAVAMTKALLPELRASKGRIVNISSVSGMVASPGFASYAASKFALEAVTDSLRRELRTHGVFVCAVQPGSIQTPIWEKVKSHAAEVKGDLAPDASSPYAELLAVLSKAMDKWSTGGSPPERVADAVEHALTSSRPHARYRVGSDAAMVRVMAALMSPRALDYVMAHI